MKKTIFKAALIVGAMATIGMGVASTNSVSAIPETKANKFDVCEYERVRAGLYDAALDLCIEASHGSYVWDEGLDDETKRIILEYRVPSLEILLHAIDTMDEFGGDLGDSFDVSEGEPLCEFDKARRIYDEYLSSIE